MKQILIAFVLAAFSLTSTHASAAHYVVDPAHSNVNFTIRHLVSKVSGKFNDFAGEFNFVPNKSSDLKDVKFTIKSDSIDTGNQKRDDHLKSPDFFDVKKYPEITFVSKKITPAGKNKFKVAGELTMHGVTKPVTLDVHYLGTTQNMMGGTVSGFTADTTLNRKDFGITWNKVLDAGGTVLGDDVEVSIALEATQDPEAAKEQAQAETSGSKAPKDQIKKK